jgi:hypothetical protein
LQWRRVRPPAYKSPAVTVLVYLFKRCAIMRFFTSIAATAVAVFPIAIASTGKPHKPYDMDPDHYKPDHLIKTDVVVVGGGAAGTYAAIQLKDQHKKVVVIESKARLGGHTETYHDPESGQPIDMGVLLYHDEPIVHEWYARFNLSLSRIDFGSAAPQYVDFRTGKIEKNVPAADQTAVAAALQRYAAVLQKYPDLDKGYFFPNPAPKDLYMPFGEFVKKYDIGAAVQFIFGFTSAAGDILELPALQQFRTLSLSLLKTVNNFQTSSVEDNSLLYEKATAELLAAKSLLLSSKVLATERVSDSGHVKVLVETPKGCTLIIAKKLLMTIPPVASSLAAFDVCEKELNLFRQFEGIGYYTSVIRNAGAGTALVQSIALDKPYALPPMPVIFNIGPVPANPSLSLVYYGTKLGQIASDGEAKAAIVADLKRYQKANGIKPTEPEFMAFSNHSPYNLQVSGEATKNGFYQELYALQGKRNTFWSGATWKAHDSSSTWAFTKDIVLPKLMKSL